MAIKLTPHRYSPLISAIICSAAKRQVTPPELLTLDYNNSHLASLCWACYCSAFLSWSWDCFGCLTLKRCFDHWRSYKQYNSCAAENVELVCIRSTSCNCNSYCASFNNHWHMDHDSSYSAVVDVWLLIRDHAAAATDSVLSVIRLFCLFFCFTILQPFIKRCKFCQEVTVTVCYAFCGSSLFVFIV